MCPAGCCAGTPAPTRADLACPSVDHIRGAVTPTPDQAGPMSAHTHVVPPASGSGGSPASASRPGSGLPGFPAVPRFVAAEPHVAGSSVAELHVDASPVHATHMDAPPSPSPPTGASPPHTRLQRGVTQWINYKNIAKYGLACTAAGEPRSLTDALGDAHWKKAMEEEYKALRTNKMWHLVPRSQGKNLIDCKCVIRIKRKSDGTIDRFKA